MRCAVADGAAVGVNEGPSAAGTASIFIFHFSDLICHRKLAKLVDSSLNNLQVGKGGPCLPNLKLSHHRQMI